jgi:hypothetical protein
LWDDKSGQAIMVGEQCILSHAQFEIEHVQEFALNATHITFAEYTRAQCPMNVFQR